MATKPNFLICSYSSHVGELGNYRWTASDNLNTVPRFVSWSRSLMNLSVNWISVVQVILSWSALANHTLVLISTQVVEDSMHVGCIVNMNTTKFWICFLVLLTLETSEPHPLISIFHLMFLLQSCSDLFCWSPFFIHECMGVFQHFKGLSQQTVRSGLKRVRADKTLIEYFWRCRLLFLRAP